MLDNAAARRSVATLGYRDGLEHFNLRSSAAVVSIFSDPSSIIARAQSISVGSGREFLDREVHTRRSAEQSRFSNSEPDTHWYVLDHCVNESLALHLACRRRPRAELPAKRQYAILQHTSALFYEGL